MSVVVVQAANDSFLNCIFTVLDDRAVGLFTIVAIITIGSFPTLVLVTTQYLGKVFTELKIRAA